jgi:hypothetical protein
MKWMAEIKLPNHIEIYLAPTELGIAYNALLQPLLGFGWEFSHTGWSLQEAENFFQKIKEKYDHAEVGNTKLRLSPRELHFLILAQEETLKELGEEEYSTLTGHIYAEAKHFLRELKNSA